MRKCKKSSIHRHPPEPKSRKPKTRIQNNLEPRPMAYRFDKHYTREEARALLPQVRKWLKRMGNLRREMETCDERLNTLRQAGADLGGELVNTLVRTLAEIREVLLEFYQREIQI